MRPDYVYRPVQRLIVASFLLFISSGCNRAEPLEGDQLDLTARSSDGPEFAFFVTGAVPVFPPSSDLNRLVLLGPMTSPRTSENLFLDEATLHSLRAGPGTILTFRNFYSFSPGASDSWCRDWITVAIPQEAIQAPATFHIPTQASLFYSTSSTWDAGMGTGTEGAVEIVSQLPGELEIRLTALVEAIYIQPPSRRSLLELSLSTSLVERSFQYLDRTLYPFPTEWKDTESASHETDSAKQD